MILLIKGVITRNYIYDLKHLNVIKKIQKSFDIFDSFRIRISLPRERDYSESTIASARAKHLDHQETFCVWAEHVERKCYLQSGRSFEDVVKTRRDRDIQTTWRLVKLHLCSLKWSSSQAFLKVGVGPGCQSCNTNADLWDCVGEDRDWSLIFVDLRHELD